MYVEAITEIVVPDNRDVLRRKLSNKLGGILRLMKVIGAYYGDTTLNEESQVNSNFFSRFYCTIVALGQWTLVCLVVTSLFHEGLENMPNFYLLLIASIWCLQNAIVTALCLCIFPNRGKKASRFHRFLSNLLSNATATDLEGVTTQTVKRLVALTCSMSALITTTIVLLDAFHHHSIARFRPWNGSTVYRVVIVSFGAFDSFTWTVPFCLFCVSCAFLERMFDNLLKKISIENPPTLSVGSLRKEHQKLCETVAMANEVFSPFLLVVIALEIPLLCVDFNQLVRLPSLKKEGLIYFISVLYWCVIVTAKLTVTLIFGVRVNEKVRFHERKVSKVNVIYLMSTGSAWAISRARGS